MRRLKHVELVFNLFKWKFESRFVSSSSSAGTTEKTLIEVLTQRSNAQRQLIATAYQKATGRVWKKTKTDF